MFPESIPTEMINPGYTINETDADLGAKLSLTAGLATDYRTNMRLMNADNAIIATMTPITVHQRLLSIHLSNYPELLLLLAG